MPTRSWAGPETNQLLEGLKKDQPGLVEELVPALISMGDVEKVLQGLLRERVPVRDLSTILEAIADAARNTKEPLFLTEAVRHALCRAISMRYRAPDGAIHAVALAPELDTRLGCVGHGPAGLRRSGAVRLGQPAADRVDRSGRPELCSCSATSRSCCARPESGWHFAT
jgi:hypothetical protein